jgi:hypothetical protein
MSKRKRKRPVASKRKRKRSGGGKKLPLTSPNWWPWRRAILYVREQVGADHVADFNLAAAMNSRDVRIKLEAIDHKQTPPKRISLVLDEVNFFPFFKVIPNNGLLVQQLTSERRMFPGAAFFAWRPDLEKIWPPIVALAAPGDGSRHKPGPKYTDEWPTHVAAWLIRIARDEPDRLDNVDRLTRDASQFLDGENVQAPQDHKRRRPIIIGFLRYVRE